MKPLLAFLFLTASLAFAQIPDLTLARDKNWLIIQGPHLPKGEIRINYLKAYCRTHSDFRIGGLKPGETKHIRGKIYIVPHVSGPRWWPDA